MALKRCRQVQKNTKTLMDNIDKIKAEIEERRKPKLTSKVHKQLNDIEDILDNMNASTVAYHVNCYIQRDFDYVLELTEQLAKANNNLIKFYHKLILELTEQQL